MKVTKHKDATNFEIGTKRLHLPFTVEGTCPNCKEAIMFDLSDDAYLSYPQIGVPIRETIYCYECDIDVPVKLQLDVELKILEK